ncbi:MAG: hypothetical protein MZV64_62400 [Ignavibacteriales bacterium]|nr:hypothetical protein [Ignavibacteriales bacterium]
MLSARYKQLDVSVQRMYRLMENAPAERAGRAQPGGSGWPAARGDLPGQNRSRPPERAWSPTI